MRSLLSFALVLSVAGHGFAQNQTRVGADFEKEGEALSKCGGISSIADCGQTLVTGQPMHIAFGSLSPQNGFGAGLAFVEHLDAKNEWRYTFNSDAIATLNGSWRAGLYVKGYRLGGGMTFGPSAYLTAYSETTSLRHIDFYGLGPSTILAAKATFGLRENVTGINGVFPLTLPVGKKKPGIVALTGEVNGRFPSVRSDTNDGAPSIEQVYNDTTAPGLSHQSAYFQPGEGVRLRPALANDFLRLNYFFNFQQFIAAGDSSHSFRRWNVDLGHEIPLYRLVPGKIYSKTRSSIPDQHGPDDCSSSDSPSNPALPCPKVQLTQNLEGSINFRFFMSESMANAGKSVPFHLAPTIGGSDINGTSMLGSYADYRFRGPDLLLLRATIEHSLGKLPAGAIFSVDGGKIGLRRDDINFNNLRCTYSAGLTLHAGGLPVVSLVFDWGGPEGNHTIFNLSPVLLGGSARPSLF